MSVIYALIAAIFLIWLLAFKKIKNVKKVTPPEIGYFLEILLVQGLKDGTLLIRIPADRKKKTFCFKKYIQKKQKHGIGFFFPLTPYSRPYYEPLIKIITDREMKFEIVKESGDIGEYIEIDFKRNVRAAFSFSRTVLSLLYGIGNDMKVELILENIREGKGFVPLKA